ncbi:MAG TPA: DUF3489 domain-containing protein [Alphaproteobacteria bacterium]|jgi:hypothetical protein
MPKLTDTQLVILNAAVGRDSKAVLPLPKSLKVNKGAATSVLNALLTKGLIEEQPTKLRAGVWRQDQIGQRYLLTITDTGMATLDSGPASTIKKPPAASAKNRTQTQRGTEQGKPVNEGAANKRPTGKLATILGLLQRSKGAPLVELEKATGWQPHSVRAAMTGLRKRDIVIQREKQNGVTRYRVATA